MKKNSKLIVFALLVISLVFTFIFDEVAAENDQKIPQQQMIISSESLDPYRHSSTGSFDLQQIRTPITYDESLPMDAYKIDMNLQFNPKEEQASLYNLSKNERRIPMKVGSTKNFWVVDFNTYEDVSIKAELLYSGEKSEVWVHDKEITVNQAKHMGQEFDREIYPVVTKNFAKESDVDGNGKVSILVYDIQDDFDHTGVYTGGYFYSRDLYDTNYSNRSEVFYIDTYPTMGFDRSNYDVSKAFSTLAHEFQHLVNYNQNVLIEDGEPMETWLDEAMSMAAEHMYSKEEVRPRMHYYERSASIANGHSLLYWDNSGDVVSNYSLSYLFGQYLRIQLKPGDQVFKKIIDQKLPTKKALQAVLNESFKDKKLEEFLTDFRHALLLNEAEGLYGFKEENNYFTITPPIYEGPLPTQLRGGGSIIVPIDEPFKFVRPKNADKSMGFRLISLGDENSTHPKQPIVDSLDETAEKITGTAEKNGQITVYKNKQVIGTSYAGEDGKFEVSIKKQLSGTILHVIVTDLKGNASVATSVEVAEEIAKEQVTSLLGHIKSGNTSVYSKLTKQTEKKPATQYTNRVYYIKKQATYKNELYYLLSTQPSAAKGVIGWMKATDISSHSHTGFDKKQKVFYVKGTSGSGFDTAWGGSKNLVHADLKQLKGAKFTVDLTEKVGNNIWYRGMLEGKQTWLHNSYVADLDEIYKEQTTSRLGHIKNGKSLIYVTPYDQTSTKSSESFTNSVYYIKKQARLNDELYYLLSREPSAVKGVIGWMKASEVSSHPHVGLDKQVKSFYVKGTGGAGYSRAWGGNKNLVHADLKQLKGAIFTVHLTEKVGNNTWYRGMLEGKQTWIHSSYVTELNDNYQEQRTSRLGHIKNGKSFIYTTPYDQKNKKLSNPFTNNVYYIKKQASLNGELYYLLSHEPSTVKGVIGWMKASEISSHPHVGVDKEAKTFYVKGVTGAGYTRAWGGSKNLVHADLKRLKEAKFTVNLTEKVGNNIWYRGILEGKQTWLHSSYVKD